MDDEQKLREVWKQWKIPVVLRRPGKGEKVRLRLPLARGNELWLRTGHNREPQWVEKGKYWEIPKSWFNDFVERALDKYGSLYVIQPHREQETCSPACWNAIGHECQCSCMGANHGADRHRDLFVVSDTFATRWNDAELACRLMTKPSFRPAPKLPDEAREDIIRHRLKHSIYDVKKYEDGYSIFDKHDGRIIAEGLDLDEVEYRFNLP
jgi:hypothetical protein